MRGRPGTETGERAWRWKTWSSVWTTTSLSWPMSWTDSFPARRSKRLQSCGPRERHQLLEYQGRQIPSVALNAVVGRPREKYGYEPAALSQLLKGCYDVHARVDDMNVNGVAASMKLLELRRHGRRVLLAAEDKDLALTHLCACRDWHLDEWCGAYPDRFIPIGLTPQWDPQPMAEEVRRLAAKASSSTTTLPNATCRACTPTTGSRCGRRSPTARPRYASTSGAATSPVSVHGVADRGEHRDNADARR